MSRANKGHAGPAARLDCEFYSIDATAAEVQGDACRLMVEAHIAGESRRTQREGHIAHSRRATPPHSKLPLPYPAAALCCYAFRP